MRFARKNNRLKPELEFLKPGINGRSKGRLFYTALILVMSVSGLFLAACGDSTPTPGAVAPSPSSAPINTPIQVGNVSSFGTIITPASSATTTALATTAVSVPTAAPTTTTSATTEPKPGGNLQLVLSAEPDLLDPAKSIQSTSDVVNTLLYGRLVYIGRDGLPKPWLAESWKIDDSGRILTFKMRSGLKFTDGTPLDARAVKVTFDRILDPKTASPAKAQMGSLQSVEVVDNLNVAFKFSEPFAPFFTNISLGFGGIVSPTALAKYGDQFGRNPVGSGPFMFKEWKTGQSIILVRNLDYKNFREDGDNKETAYLDSITWNIISEPGTRIAALQQGSLDIANLEAENVATINQNSSFKVFQWKTGTNINFIEFANKAPTNDPEFRKAIAYAIDRKNMVESAWGGFATANPSPLPTGVAGWNNNVSGYNYDPAKAKSILYELGYTAGADGILQKNGKPLSLVLTTFSGSASGKRSAELVQFNLKEVGIDVKVRITDPSTLLKTLQKGDFDISLMRWAWPDPTLLSLLFKTPGWTNQYSNKELDAMLTKADTTLDPVQRLNTVKNLQNQIIEQVVVVPIATDWTQTAIHKKVQGFKWDALGYVIYNDVWIAS